VSLLAPYGTWDITAAAGHPRMEMRVPSTWKALAADSWDIPAADAMYRISHLATSGIDGIYQPPQLVRQPMKPFCISHLRDISATAGHPRMEMRVENYCKEQRASNF